MLFADPQQPVLEKIHADGLLPPGMSLCVTDTRGSHSELTGEFAAIRQEMEQIARGIWWALVERDGAIRDTLEEWMETWGSWL